MNDVKSAFSVLLFTLVLYCCPGCFMPSACGQLPAFVPAEENNALLSTLSIKSEQLYKEDLAKLPAANRKDYEDIYKSRWDNIKNVFEKKEIYTSATAQHYLDALVKEIVRNNPALQQSDFHCYFSRSGVPNASYIGEGIILFNMGLFMQLRNENEAAFVLCHEMAHYYLRHSERSIEQYVANMNSKEMQAALRKIKKSEFGKREQLEKLMKGFTFNSRRHTRDHESQADSMAIEFLRNTRFDKRGALSVLALLDNIDQDTLNTGACLRQLFNAEKYPFKDKWIARQSGLLGGHAILEKDKVLEDSLKTHPDCQKRIRLLEPLVTAYTDVNADASVIDKKKFDSLKHIFRYEVIEYAFRNDNYTLSLYYTISLLQQYPRDAYLVTQVGKMLNSCFDAQRGHVLGKKIELPSPGESPAYNVLLQFVQNLYLEDYAGISYYYLLARQDQCRDYQPFNNELKKSRQLLTQ
jgi:Zn-dependent protease with chaperone function